MSDIVGIETEKNEKRLYILQKNTLTLEEACLYLGIKPSFMYKLTSKRMIPHSVPNGKLIYFERAELDNWARQNKRRSLQGIKDEVEESLLRNQKEKGIS